MIDLPTLHPGRKARRVAAIATTLLAGSAHAQAPLAPEPLGLEVAQSLVADANLFRLPDGFDAPAGGDRSDLISITTVRGELDRRISGQRVVAAAEVNAARYASNENLDYVGWNINANWEWQAGRQWYGAFGLGDRRVLASFADVAVRQRNVVDFRTALAQVGYRFDPDWSLVAGLDLRERVNSSRLVAAADLREIGVEAGVRYQPRNGLDVYGLARRVDGEFPNRQLATAGGVPLPATVDNRYTQDQLLTRVAIDPGGASRIVGEIGLTRRTHPNVPQRDFTGPTANLAWTWLPTDKLLTEVFVRRDLGATEQLFASTVDFLRAGLRQVWRPTAKTSMQLLLEMRRIDFGQDPGFVARTGPASRGDRQRSLALSGSWEPMRNWRVGGELRREVRDSSSAFFDFETSIASAFLQVRFE